MGHDKSDLRMSFRTAQGVEIEIYDTFCKDFTQREKEVVDAKINELLRCAGSRRALEAQAGEGT